MNTKRLLYLVVWLIIATFYTGCSFLPYENMAPVIDSTPPTRVKVETLYNYDVKVTDLEENVMVYSLVTYPEGMTINSLTGEITWTPTEKQIGNHQVTIKVSDRWRWDTQSFMVTVYDILLTSIEVLPPAMTLMVGDSSLFTAASIITSVVANFDDGTKQNVEFTTCSYQSSNTKVATVSNNGVIAAVNVGVSIVTVSYTKGSVTKSGNIKVTVTALPVEAG
jgi:hypothetical protein